MAAPSARWPWLAAAATLLLALVAAYGEGLLGRMAIDGAASLPALDPLYAGAGAAGPAASLANDATPAIFNQPWDHWAWALMRAGEAPLWQPQSGFGVPLLGSGQSNPLSPFKLLLAFGVTGPAQAWYLVARLAFAALGVLVLARRLGLGAAPGALAALAFTSSAAFTYHLQYGDTSAMVCLPWLVWAGERLLAEPGPRAAALLALAIALPAFTGHAEIAVFCAAGGLACTLAGAARAPRVLPWLAAAVAGGVALAAVVVLPFVEAVRQSDSYLYNLADRVRFTLDYTLAAKLQLMAVHLVSATGRRMVVNFNPWVGAVALALVPFGWGRGPVRRVAGTLLAVTAVVIAICPPGQHWAVLPVAPNAYYAMPLVALALALAAAGGLERLQAEPRLAPAAAGVAAALAALAWRLEGRAEAMGPGYGDFRATVATAVAAAVLLALLRWRPRPVATALVLLAGLELVWGARVATPPRPPFTYPATPILQALAARPGPFRVSGGLRVLLPDTQLLHGLEQLDSIEVFQPRRTIAFMRALLRNQHDVNMNFGLESAFAPDLLDLANVRYLLVAEGGDPILARQLARYPLVARQGAVALRENPRVLPRAWVAYAADFMPPGAEAAGRRLAATPARWRTHALVETPDGRPPVGWTDGGLPPGAVAIVDHAAQHEVFEATLPRPGFLLVAEACDGGWQAEVDGRPADILPADAALRAVYLPAGHHRVAMRYAPAGFRWGLAISLLALALALGALRSRPAPPAPTA